MEADNETWKWGLVIILLGVFLLVGSQAYQSFFTPENYYPAPDDYLKGDSYDQEQNQVGPGMNQPTEVPATITNFLPRPDDPPPTISSQSTATAEPDWNQIKDPSQN